MPNRGVLMLYLATSVLGYGEEKMVLVDGEARCGSLS